MIHSYIDSVEEPKFRINMLRSLVCNLPKNNRVLLQYLLSLLSTVIQHSHNNHMDIHKLSKVFGGILLKPKAFNNSYSTHALVECPGTLINTLF